MANAPFFFYFTSDPWREEEKNPKVLCWYKEEESSSLEPRREAFGAQMDPVAGTWAEKIISSLKKRIKDFLYSLGHYRRERGRHVHGFSFPHQMESSTCIRGAFVSVLRMPIPLFGSPFFLLLLCCREKWEEWQEARSRWRSCANDGKRTPFTLIRSNGNSVMCPMTFFFSSRG